MSASEKVGLWPEKVGRRPFFKTKVGRKNGQKWPKNCQKPPFSGVFSGFLRPFWGVLRVCGQKPTFSLYFSIK
nr:MAG TPA: hypothetical protein [Caudoviricetes sp.]